MTNCGPPVHSGHEHWDPETYCREYSPHGRRMPVAHDRRRMQARLPDARTVALPSIGDKRDGTRADEVQHRRRPAVKAALSQGDTPVLRPLRPAAHPTARPPVV